MKKRKIGILTGGGDVAPLNAVLFSTREEAIKNNYELIGFNNGWQGMLDDDFVSLSKTKIDPLIGGTILKSSRVNLAKVENGANNIQAKFEKMKLDGLIVIGGEDTLSNAFLLQGLPIVLLSKTIDNDVGINQNGRIINYFTLGYPTAANKISSFVSLKDGLRTTAYSHERIIVVESMGMHAGWLALSSSMGNPDFIVIPEFPVEYGILIEKVKERYSTNKNVIIVVAEGSKWSNGEYISADFSEMDSFGHPRFKGAANVLAEKLKTDLKKNFDTRNVNAVNPSYLYRSGSPAKLDLTAGIKLGKKAMAILQSGIHAPLFLTTNFKNNKFVLSQYSIESLGGIEDFHRFIDERYYNAKELCATKEAKAYLSRIIKEIPIPKYGL